ncbi:hypothetical protein HRI_003171100 [Hibiscus trionum]|uniref:Uncharacterized protein n=1 Tax=Hibiscus trionum TaxID=183268 RepID=A0A9W7IIW2_HIBTR|nr:hypothetical protein HRI_003171100 [Hibiscus trionum]
MQGLYNTTFKNLNRSQAQNTRLEVRIAELDWSFQEYRNQNGFLELQVSQYENMTLRAQINTLETTVQDYLGRLVVLKGSRERGDDYWQRRLRDATRMIQDRDDYNTTLMVQVQEVARHVRDLAVEAEALRSFVALEMDKTPRFLQLLEAIEELGVRAGAYL